ncbi:ATP-binding protein [Pseudobacteriovorax antillogorgiicola]|uniref:sensor histidine kinase n=1 Tax=Pseudobacteriovorax antillogorgiicola TaxID=1513793 RepID=UPI0014043ADA|nr:ATP-binding protein [Pseudobacteriovorax antillogorgiicola]
MASIEIGQGVRYLIETKSLSLDAAVVALNEGRFVGLQEPGLPPQYFDHGVWVSLTVDNQDSKSWTVASVYNALDRFDVFVREPNGGFKRVDVLESRVPAFELKEGFREYLIRQASLSSMGVRFLADKSDAFRDKEQRTLILIAMMLGILFALTLYKMFLWLSLGDRLYLFYVFYVSTNTFSALMIVNFPIGTLHFLGPDTLYYLPYFRFIFPLTAFLFAYDMLTGTTGNNSWFGKALLGYCGLLLITPLLYAVSPWQSFVRASLDGLFLLGLVLLILLSAMRTYQGSRSAFYYLVSQISFFGFAFLYLVTLQGGIVFNEWTQLFIMIGLCTQLIMMAFALAARIKEIDHLRRAAEIEASVRRKTAEELRHLFRIISHDINNALSLVSGAAFAAQRRDPENFLLGKILKGAGIIESIISGVKDYELHLDRNETVDLESVSLQKVAEEIRFLFAERAKEKGVELDISGGPNICVKAVESTLVNEVLGNFVSNAIKFTDPGSSIQLSWQETASRAVITIKDTGIGIPEELLQNLNENQKLSSTIGTNGEKGTGFGLQIALRSIQSFLGRYDFQSRPKDQYGDDSGTEITVYLQKAELPV